MTETISELELQQELQRFTTTFCDRVSQATEVLEGSRHAKVRDEALHKCLKYVSSAMEIATGPSSEINLLDMFVFIRLSRAALEKHLIPNLYRHEGAELATAFERADEELGSVAKRALGARLPRLENLVRSWLADNPDQVRVEGIRLADFSTMAGNAAAGRAIESKGLLSSPKMASDAANQALLLAERGMFLLHRMPFLWRLQVRVGSREITNDAIVRASTGLPLKQLLNVARLSAAAAAVLGFTGLVWMYRRR